MSTRWERLGRVIEAPPALGWARSHAALPTVEPGARALYFSTRDAGGRSSIARATLDPARELPLVAAVDPEPVLAPGSLGAFDDAGVTPSCVVVDGDERRLYYTGWSLGVSVPFYLAIGLAVSSGGGPFTRVSAAPILGRTASDPYLTASPHVLRDGGRWRMWYVSGARWSRRGDEVRHHYHLRHGESEDGTEWRTDGRACVDFADEREYAFSRPCVLRGAGGYEMWYSVRGDAYRLGYARSADGLRWERHDADAGLAPAATPGAWDGEMIAYPHVFDHGGRRLLLYNGNGYGLTGIGAAVQVHG